MDDCTDTISRELAQSKLIHVTCHFIFVGPNSHTYKAHQQWFQNEVSGAKVCIEIYLSK